MPPNEMKPSASAAIGRCRVQLHFGSITEETTRAVVNSVRGGSYGGGSCAKAIKEAAGESLAGEYKRRRASAINKDIVVTEAGNMLQEKILHVVVNSDPHKMADVVRKTLQEAEEEKLDSIAFPALGSGKMNSDPKKLAIAIFEAMRDFARDNHPEWVHFIKLTIFRESLFDVYKEAMRQTLGEYFMDD